MMEQATENIPRGIGPHDEVLHDFGLTRTSFTARLHTILAQDPSATGLAPRDIAEVLALCSR